MKNTILIIAVIVIFAIVGIFTMRYFTGGGVNDAGVVKEFTIKAFQYGYSPDAIEVNKGDKVKIIVENTDVPHGIRIPDLDVRGENSVEFTAEESGEFKWYCTIFCGDGHRSMNGTLIVK